jgi:hypothetical protein
MRHFGPLVLTTYTFSTFEFVKLFASLAFFLVFLEGLLGGLLDRDRDRDLDVPVRCLFSGGILTVRHI